MLNQILCAIIILKSHYSIKYGVYHETLEYVTCKPAFVPIFSIFYPGFVPGVGKVNEEYELDYNEDKGSHQSEVKPHCEMKRKRYSILNLLNRYVNILIIISQEKDIVQLLFLVIQQTDIHTIVKCPIRDEKGSHCNPDQDQKLKEPEPEDLQTYN